MEKVKKRDEVPTLLARPAGAQWKVWWPYCCEYHFHGALPGHRVAHCIGETPFKRTGYCLKFDPDLQVTKP